MFLKQFKSKEAEMRKVDFPSWKRDKDVEEILVDVPERLRKLKMKLLKFHDNRRPTYYGTCIPLLCSHNTN